jgi:hypothetical protein
VAPGSKFVDCGHTRNFQFEYTEYKQKDNVRCVRYCGSVSSIVQYPCYQAAIRDQAIDQLPWVGIANADIGALGEQSTILYLN